MQFSQIPGLEDVKDRLKRTVLQNKIAHAQLFAGIPGSASLPLAVAYSTFLNCDNRSESDSCGTCPSCVKNKGFVHPDLHFVFPVSATKTVTGSDVVSKSFLKEWRTFLAETPYGTIEDWALSYGGENKQALISRQESREIIKDLSLKAFEGAYKVMIIWLPELMHPSAANAILKILEEPPDNTVFLLVTQNSEALLTTILSRTQMVNVRPFTPEEVKTALSNGEADSERLHQIALLARGSLGQANKLAGDIEDNTQELFGDWMRSCYQMDFEKLVGWSDKFGMMSRMGQRMLLQYGLNIVREVLVVHSGSDELAAVQGGGLEFVQNFGKVFTPDKLDALNNYLNDAIFHLERNANPRIMFLDLSITVGRTLKQ